MTSSDRLRLYNRLLGLGLLFHLTHLEIYQTFLPSYAARFWLSPGWHNFLPNWYFLVTYLSLLIGTIGILFKPNRFFLVWISFFGLFDYLTFSFRLVNHYLVVLGVFWYQLLTDLILDPSRDNSKEKIFGIRMIFFITFFMAAFHKLNFDYWRPDPSESFGAYVLIRVFKVLSISSSPNQGFYFIAISTSVFFEAFSVPIILYLQRGRFLALLGYFFFWFVLLLTIKGPDYTFFGLTFGLLLFEEAQWRSFLQDGLATRWALPLMGIAYFLISIFLGGEGWRLAIYIPWGTVWAILSGQLLKNIWTGKPCASC